MANSLGVFVSSTESSVASTGTYNTANAFIIGLADWGAATGAGTPVAVGSLSQAQAVIGPRSVTNATLYDSLDAFFHEAAGTGAIAYIGRVVGPSPTNATLVLNSSVTVNALYPGNYGNALLIAVTNNTSSVVITVTDTYGNTLAVSPSLASVQAIVSWAGNTGYITAVNNGSTLPPTSSATALSGGSDNRGSATLANYTAALANFGGSLGPGQVLAPGVSDWGSGAVVGITNALGQHAQSHNRVAIVDLPDATAASALVTDVGSTFNSAGAGPIGLWAGNLNIPGVVPATTRNIPPSAAIAALCAQADAKGNPNLMAAGVNFTFQYVTGSTSFVSGNLATYNDTDLQTLHAAGINTFRNRFGLFENYGFDSTFTSDGIFNQFNHQRMRMALQAQAQIIGEPFVFTELDGQGGDINGFANALSLMLTGFYNVGALYGASSSDAFTVDVSGSVNTPASLQAGQLNALVSVRLSPGAEQVTIVLNAVPITQSLPSQAAA